MWIVDLKKIFSFLVCLIHSRNNCSLLQCNTVSISPLLLNLTFSFFFHFHPNIFGHRYLHRHRLDRYQMLAKWTWLSPANAADFPQVGEKWRGANEQLSSAVETCKTGQWTYRQIAEWCTSYFKRKADDTVYNCPDQPKEAEASLRMAHHMYFVICGQNNSDNLIYIYFLSVLVFYSLCLSLFSSVLILRHSRVPVLFLIAFTDKRTHAHNTIAKKIISRKAANQSKPAPKHAHVSAGEFPQTSAAASFLFGSFLFPWKAPSSFKTWLRMFNSNSTFG